VADRARSLPSILAAALCVLALCYLIWSLDRTYYGQTSSLVGIAWPLWAFVPVVTLLWAIVAVRPWRTRTYVWMRRAVQVQAIGISLLILALAFWLSGDSGLPAAAIAAISANAIMLALLPNIMFLGLAPRVDATEDAIRFYQRAQLVLSGGALAVIFLWSFANIAIVAAQAGRAAAGAPYCLQVPGSRAGSSQALSDRYRPAGALMDLNGFVMQAPKTWLVEPSKTGTQLAFHCVLAVKTASGIVWRHWSYRQQRFVAFDPKPQTMTLACAPRLNFVRNLPLR